MNQEIEKAIKELREEIKEKENYIHTIQKVNWEKPITEKEWHTICETPLRYSPLLGVMLKNIFPEAKEIKVDCNYVFFALYGFQCVIPTSRCKGIEVRTDWYVKDNGIPKEENIYYGINDRMRKYFDAVDMHESWDVLLKYRVPSSDRYRRWVRFLMWFGKYKWRDPHRQEWEKEFEKDKKTFEMKTSQYLDTRRQMKDKVLYMRDKLLPELYKFTEHVRTFRSTSMYNHDINEILALENLYITL